MAELFTTTLFSDANLVAYYRLNGNSNDSKGSNNGTDSNISYVSGKFGSSASFNGTSSSILLSSVPVTSSTAFTISCWLKKADTGVKREMVSYGNPSGNDLAMYYTVNASNKLSWELFGRTPITSTASVADNTWKHCVVTYAGGVGGAVKLYINGAEDGSGTASANIGSTRARIGASPDASPAEFWSGELDDIAIFNKALSAAEVLTLFRESGSALFFSQI